MGNPYRGRNQKPIIADHEMQIGPARPFAPPDVSITGAERKRAGTEGQRTYVPMDRAFHEISDLSAAQRPAPKIVKAIQKRKPNLGLLAVSTADRIYRYIAQFLQTATYGGNLKFNGGIGRTLKIICLFSPGQIYNTPAIQFGQGLTAAHVLKLPVKRAPIQPSANLPRQLVPGDGWSLCQRLLYPGDHKLSEEAYERLKTTG